MIKRPERTSLGTMNKSRNTLSMQSRVPYWVVSSDVLQAIFTEVRHTKSLNHG